MEDEPRQRIKHEISPLAMRQMRFAMMCVTGEPGTHKTDDERAAACGWTEPGDGARVRAMPEVERLIRQVSEELRSKVIERAVENLPTPSLTLMQVMEELWKVGRAPLADFERFPQVKVNALRAVAEILLELRSEAPPEQPAKDTRPVPKAAWQKKGIRPS